MASLVSVHLSVSGELRFLLAPPPGSASWLRLAFLLSSVLHEYLMGGADLASAQDQPVLIPIKRTATEMSAVGGATRGDWPT